MCVVQCRPRAGDIYSAYEIFPDFTKPEESYQIPLRYVYGV
jgi:hypothetical protein